MRALRQLWRQFWFTPAAPTNLAICRVLFFGAMMGLFWRRDYRGWADVSDALWDPIALFRFGFLPVLPSAALGVVQTVWKITMLLSCIGLFTRVSTLIAFLLGVYLVGLPHNFGTDHHDALMVLTLGIMALSRCGDRWSVDRLIGISGSRRVASASPASGEYTWPIRAVWTVMVLVFFASGVAKLRHSGVQWITSETFANLLLHATHHPSDVPPLTSLSLPLVNYDLLCHLLAATTILIEVGAPLALMDTWARWVLVPSWLGMQIGIRVLMGVSFDEFIVCYVFWVPWDRVLQSVTVRRAERVTAYAK